MVALKQRIFVGHLERATSIFKLSLNNHEMVVS
ncbi:hypothetical protein NSTC745_04007 [Nostoc sp. DSM 114161]|jgi:hypothetical protein